MDKGYKTYKDLEGSYDFETFPLFVDHVQVDPFAEPSKFRIRMANSVADFPGYWAGVTSGRRAADKWGTNG